MPGSYDYVPTHFNNTSLTASPFSSVRFNTRLWPARSADRQAVAAALAGRGDRLIRMQQGSAVTELLIVMEDGLQTTLNAVARVFDDEAGLVFLRADDGEDSATNWRVALQLIRLERMSPLEYKAVCYVPDPIWESNAEISTTGDFANMSSSPETQAVANAGNRKAWPILEITPDASKEGDPAADFLVRHNGTFAQRSPLALRNYPVMVNSNGEAGGANPFNTQQAIKDTATHALVNDAGGVGISDTTIDFDTETGSLRSTGGFIIFDEGGPNEEQIYYANKSGGQLTGCVRGVGGTTAKAHSNNDQFFQSNMLLDGSDLRVYYGGVEVERWLGGLNTTNTRIWINVDEPPRVRLEPVAAVDISQTVIEFKDVSEVEIPNVITMDRELMAVTARDVAARTLTVIRGVYFSSAATHDVSDYAYANVKQLFICYNRYGLGAAPEPLARRPAIDLVQSDNHRWYMFDLASDPLTVAWDPDNPDRPASWVPNYYVPPEDENDAPPMQLFSSNDGPQWKDEDPEHGKPQVGRLRLSLPCGVQDVASAITYDVNRDPRGRALIYGRDIEGLEVLLVDEWTDDDSEGVSGPFNITPDQELFELTLSAVRAPTLGNPNYKTGSYYLMSTSGDFVENQFELDKEGTFDALLLRLWENSTPNNDFTVKIYFDNGSDAKGGLYFQFVNWSVNGTEEDFPPDDLGTSAGKIIAFFNLDAGGNRVPWTMPPGKYWWELDCNISSGGQLRVGIGPIETKHGAQENGTFSTVASDKADRAWYALIHAGAGPIFEGAEKHGENKSISFKDVNIHLNDAGGGPLGGGPMTPRVDTSLSHNGSIQHLIPRIKNDTTGEYIDLDVFVDVDRKVTVDTFKKLLTRDIGWSGGAAADVAVEDAPHGVKFASSQEWIRIAGAAAADVFSYTETGILNTDMTVKHRDRKAV